MPFRAPSPDPATEDEETKAARARELEESAAARIAVSAPGKVFLAGGYLVLDRDYTALVFGLDARIHVVVGEFMGEEWQEFYSGEVHVHSPQFQRAVWKYSCQISPTGESVQVKQAFSLTDNLTGNTEKNPFIETTLAYVLNYVHTIKPKPQRAAVIQIFADRDYYSTPPKGNLSSNHFANFAIPLRDVHKTGLGSSAALVTSLTAALLRYHLPASSFDLTTPTSKTLLFKLAQAAHCAAQGKVGSGFDVASAVYGSCLYRRFSPALLSSIPSHDDPSFATHLKSVLEQQWDEEINTAAVAIPPGLRLVMCDVDCGSETPGMVKQVLAWRAADKERADSLWKVLQKHNEGLAADLTAVSTVSQSSGTPNYSDVRTRLTKIRSSIRQMSRESGVPIEPDEQTALLDACSQVEGVVGGVVPGAGGYDAVVLLVEDREEVLERLSKFVEGWDFDGNGGTVKVLGVREEMSGVRVEEGARY